MAAFPPSLPPPALGSFTESPADNSISTSMDIGPAKKRRRSTVAPKPMAFTLLLTRAQVATLFTFYETTTFSGVDSFTIEHPRTLATVTARFTAPPSCREREGVIWDTSISLEILP